GSKAINAVLEWLNLGSFDMFDIPAVPRLLTGATLGMASAILYGVQNYLCFDTVQDVFKAIIAEESRPAQVFKATFATLLAAANGLSGAGVYNMSETTINSIFPDLSFSPWLIEGIKSQNWLEASTVNFRLSALYFMSWFTASQPKALP